MTNVYKNCVKHTCKADGCNDRSFAKGYCGKHYQRWRRHGDPLAGGVTPGTSLAFLKEVVAPLNSDECFLWPFKMDNHGYGRTSRVGKTKLAHRIVCEIVHGPPPSNRHHAAHVCGQRACCNPRHIRWATAKENNDDKALHGKTNRGRRNGSAKLTEDDVRAIRASTKPASQLSMEYGIALSAVGNIKTRRRWGWLAEAAA